MLPGGQMQCAGGYSSHRGMSEYGGNAQIYTVVAVEGHTADWQGVEGRRKSADLKRPPRFTVR